MLGLLIVCSTLAAGPDLNPGDRETYQAARVQAGRDAQRTSSSPSGASSTA